MVVHEWNGLLPIVWGDEHGLVAAWFHDFMMFHMESRMAQGREYHFGNFDSYEASDVFWTTLYPRVN